MKNHKLLTLALAFATGTLLAQTADQYVIQGRTALVAHDLTGAYTNFNAAVTLSPTNQTANALLAVTRLLVLPQQPAGSNFLNSLGFSKAGRNIYNWTSSFPVDVTGHTVIPTNNTAVGVAYYRTNIMLALGASWTNLSRITDPGFTLSLTADETDMEAVTVDYGDCRLMQAGLAAWEFLGYTLNAHNFNITITHLHDLSKTNGLTIQQLLADYPSLLTQNSLADLTNSKVPFTNAIALYQNASDFIRNTRPAGQGLFVLDLNQTADEAVFRSYLTNVLLSLNQPVQFDTNETSFVSAGAYFAGTKSLRSLVPQFNGDIYVNDTVPDYTFGGVWLNEPAYLTEAALRNGFYSYAGIYLGHVDDLTFNDSDAGIFGVFLGTNQQATVVGYDFDSFQNINATQSGGIAAQFNVDSQGNWQFNSNSLAGVSGSGAFYKDGSFSGELDFTNGDSVWLNGSGQRALQNAAGNSCYDCHAAGSLASGPFQNTAGNYGGTYSMTYQGQHFTGKLKAVLSAAGQLPFCFFDPTGAQNDGGQGQIGMDNKFSTANTTSGAVFTGTLNPSTFQITGTMTNGSYGGTYTLTRSALVPFDVPPVITTNLPLTKSAPLGTNVTFSLTATGSPPMCFQWYDNNGVIIPNATTNTLVVSNLLYSSAGTYSVVIDNVVGETNAAVTLTVTAETTPPVISITNVTAGMNVSNAAFVVKGTASDNVAVSNVFYSLNTGPWTQATPGNLWTNWSAALTLLPGTNYIAAIAVDTSGNISTTNTVKLAYVVSAVLTVSTNGLGSLSPNDNGVALPINKNYSITATPATGFTFSGWTGGTSLPLGVITNGPTVQFLMVSNLMLQANFVDTNRPVISITNLTAGQRWSNFVFTAKGAATDNWQVASVQYQLNGGTWASATGTTNWSAALSLMPGTNTLAAFATDTTGNKSLTNNVSFDFVVTNQLAIRAIGLGTISPNYSNAWLEIGRNYSITSAPASGFVFTNWLVSTNWLGGTKVNSTNLTFMMNSNLTLQADFLDVTKPTLTITAPPTGQHMTNALATIVGTASDNWNVSAVWYQLTNTVSPAGTWRLVTTSNNYTNWTTTVTLTTGTNQVKAYAVDPAGNFSLTNSVSVVSSNTFQLQLQFAVTQPLATNGLNFGLQISPGLNGHIQISTNLLDWVTLTNFVGSNTSLNFRDPAATNANRRFYRAVVP